MKAFRCSNCGAKFTEDTAVQFDFKAMECLNCQDTPRLVEVASFKPDQMIARVYRSSCNAGEVGRYIATIRTNYGDCVLTHYGRSMIVSQLEDCFGSLKDAMKSLALEFEQEERAEAGK